MSNNCEMCLMRDQLGHLKSKQERNRRELGICWVNGGMINGTDETTIVTIDCSISPENQHKLLVLLQAIESDTANRKA